MTDRSSIGMATSDFSAPEHVASEQLDALPWRHASAVVMAGCHRLRVRCTSADFGAYVDELLVGLPVGVGEPDVEYSVIDGVNGHAEWWSVYAGSRRISTIGSASAAVTHLFAHVNRAVVRAAPDDAVPLHAGLVSSDGVGVLLCGPSEAGKSTLAAGLGLAGFEYVTDEVAVVDPDTLQVAPYAKPLSIDPGAWPSLPGLAPTVTDVLRTVGVTQWHVPPSRLAGGFATEPVPVGLLVRCRFRLGASVQVRPVSRAGLVLELALDMFRPRERLAHQVQVLGRLADGAGAVEVVYSDLEPAVAAVRGLL